jgi:hypothetical protein
MEKSQTTSRELNARLSAQRPGYGHIYDLVHKYGDLSPDEREKLSEVELSDFFIQPMFQALGWDVWVPPARGSRLIDLELQYKDITAAVKVKKLFDPKSLRASELTGQWVGGWDWAILTNFEIIRILDLLRNKELSTMRSSWDWEEGSYALRMGQGR